MRSLLSGLKPDVRGSCSTGRCSAAGCDCAVLCCLLGTQGPFARHPSLPLQMMVSS